MPFLVRLPQMGLPKGLLGILLLYTCRRGSPKGSYITRKEVLPLYKAREEDADRYCHYNSDNQYYRDHIIDTFIKQLSRGLLNITIKVRVSQLEHYNMRVRKYVLSHIYSMKYIIG